MMNKTHIIPAHVELTINNCFKRGLEGPQKGVKIDTYLCVIYVCVYVCFAWVQNEGLLNSGFYPSLPLLRLYFIYCFKIFLPPDFSHHYLSSPVSPLFKTKEYQRQNLLPWPCTLQLEGGRSDVMGSSVMEGGCGVMEGGCSVM